MRMLLLYWEEFVHRIRLRYLIPKRIRNKNIKFGYGFEIGSFDNLELGDNIVLGKRCFIDSRGGVIIGDGIVTGPELMIFSSNHDYNSEEFLPFADYDLPGRVEIGPNTWIGGRVLILPGVKLGEGCVIAGGSVVTKSFPALSVIGGVPAKHIKNRCRLAYTRAKESNKYAKDIRI